LSNKDALATKNTYQTDVTVNAQKTALILLRDETTEIQEQIAEYQELMKKLKVCIERNATLEKEVVTLRSKNEKLRQLLSKQNKQAQLVSEKCTNLGQEFINLKLELAQIHAKDDFIENILVKMTSKLEMKR